MDIGMLWFDNDPKAELKNKIERAAIYYRNKYGKNPTLCYVHPSMLAVAAPPAEQGSSPPANNGMSREPYRSAGVEVRSTRSVLPNHFWIGVNGTNGAGSMQADS